MAAKRLYGPALLGISPETKKTMSGGGGKLSVVHVSNPSNITIGFSLSIGADAPGTRLFDGHRVSANSEYVYCVEHPLNPGEIIQASASVADKLVMVLSGEEA